MTRAEPMGALMMMSFKFPRPRLIGDAHVRELRHLPPALHN